MEQGDTRQPEWFQSLQRLSDRQGGENADICQRSSSATIKTSGERDPAAHCHLPVTANRSVRRCLRTYREACRGRETFGSRRKAV